MSGGVEQALADARTQSGQSLAELSAQSPVLLVFLRHSGCPYCRQTLSDLGRLRSQLDSTHTQLVIVHQDTPERGAAWIAKYGLGDCQQISDPDNHLYAQFELGKASWWDLVGPHTWWPGFKATMLQMHGVSKIVGDIKQLTGAFLVRDGKVVKAFRQRYSSDRPDYASMVCDL
ncbi:MAG: SelL-related redox protein [Aureliella sp.]